MASFVHQEGEQTSACCLCSSIESVHQVKLICLNNTCYILFAAHITLLSMILQKATIRKCECLYFD